MYLDIKFSEKRVPCFLNLLQQLTAFKKKLRLDSMYLNHDCIPPHSNKPSCAYHHIELAQLDEQ